MSDPAPCRAFDPATWVFMIGCRVLATYGVGDRQARPILARWLKQMTADALLPILVRAATKERGSFVEYVERAIKGESDSEASAGSAAVTACRSDDEKFARRVAGLKQCDMLHLLSPDETLRAEKAGLLPVSAPDTHAVGMLPLSGALKRSQDARRTSVVPAETRSGSTPGNATSKRRS